MALFENPYNSNHSGQEFDESVDKSKLVQKMREDMDANSQEIARQGTAIAAEMMRAMAAEQANADAIQQNKDEVDQTIHDLSEGLSADIKDNKDAIDAAAASLNDLIAQTKYVKGEIKNADIATLDTLTGKPAIGVYHVRGLISNIEHGTMLVTYSDGTGTTTQFFFSSDVPTGDGGAKVKPCILYRYHRNNAWTEWADYTGKIEAQVEEQGRNISAIEDSFETFQIENNAGTGVVQNEVNITLSRDNDGEKQMLASMNIPGANEERAGVMTSDHVKKLSELDNGVSQLAHNVDELGKEMTNQHPQTNEEGFFVPDAQGYIGMQYTKEGLDFAKISQHAIEVLKGHDLGGTANVVNVNEEGFFVVDAELRVGMKLDSTGNVHAKNILEFEIVES